VSDGDPTRPAEPGPAPEAGEPTGATQEPPPVDPEEMTVGQLVFEVSDRASILIREEVELAKTEITEKFNSLLRGSAVGLAAGVFVLMALAMLMHGIAWLLDDLFFSNDVWAGFLIESAFFLVLAVAGGLFAYRAFKRDAPPTPEMAIEEAREIKATFDGKEKTP
jgi:uncharacterized membrane protein YqjE